MSSDTRASKKRKTKNGDFDAEVSRSQCEAERDNRLLACYLAHEFLSRGTLFGRSWSRAAGSSRAEPSHVRRGGDGDRQIYANVAEMMKSDDVHLPGIVNPTQLASWLRS
ncbi:hypothetical protein AMTR_s00067p00161830 [Amborella trichopoda]|uniref:Uncharacterized protein n=1 Tax=Amborella trichopoda TaxID=13333 RepID=U5DEQ7_AMBTC|nr:hypothetical protein AMTR_s00067p00161830 [Amborella trichopoda]